MFPSATYAAVRQRRLRSIQLRGTPELIAALDTGKISFMRAETISRLGARQQRRILEREQFKENAQRLAAEALRDLLAQAKRIDLKEVAEAIRCTVSQAPLERALILEHRFSRPPHGESHSAPPPDQAHAGRFP
jgi:hypothetical protein